MLDITKWKVNAYQNSNKQCHSLGDASKGGRYPLVRCGEMRTPVY